MKSFVPEFHTVIIQFTLLICTISLYATPLQELSEQRGTIAHQLDSLDLLKQNLKRNGITITDIELQQTQLRDSLQRLRNRIQTTSENTPLQSGGRKSSRFIQMPSNLFDWIIVIVGVVAFFSGLMLVIGISRSISSKRRRQPVTNQPIQKPSSQPSVKPKVSKPADAFPAPPSDPPMPTPVMPQSETGTINLLRQRLERSEPRATAAIPAVMEESDESNPKKSDSEDQSSLEDRVIAAAKSGLDAISISRKFHLSVDHVALVLKMSSPRK